MADLVDTDSDMEVITAAQGSDVPTAGDTARAAGKRKAPADVGAGPIPRSRAKTAAERPRISPRVGHQPDSSAPPPPEPRVGGFTFMQSSRYLPIHLLSFLLSSLMILKFMI